MLNNESKQLPRQPNLGAIAEPIPDPWSTPSTVQKTYPIPESWHLPTEPYPLISPAGNQEAPRLVSHQSTSEEILLGDELKLKVGTGSLLKQQLEKALALIYWLGTIKQPSQKWEMSPT